MDFFGGAEFAAATLPVQIMAFYSLHQAYGQLAGSVFHATGRTRVLRNMAALECVYGFTTAWFLLAPPEYMGLNLGAVGLAIKTVAVQIITVNVYLWLASRFLPLSFWRNFAHQIWSLAVLLTLAWLCREGTIMAGLGDLNTFSRFLVSGVLYSAGAGVVCVAMPALLGLSRQDVRELVARFRKSRQKSA